MNSEDTPTERDDKAEVLEDKRHDRAAVLESEAFDKAAVLAAEVRRFRWEVRTFYGALFFYLVIKELIS